jgi:subtilisin-like proprotein convertase family protein
MHPLLPPPLARFLAALTLLFPLAATPVLAFSDARPAGRFDDHIRQRHGGSIVVVPRVLESLEASDTLRAGWEDFKAHNPGNWKIYLDERTAMPTMVSGRGIEWYPANARSNASAAGLEERARAFLAEYSTILGQPSPILKLDRVNSLELRKDYWQVVFRQVIDGVTVENARLDFHVNNGRLVLFGAEHWGTPKTSAVPTLDAAAERAALDKYLGTATAEFEQVGEPLLTMVAVDSDPALDEPRAWSGPRGEGLDHALIWRLRFREPGQPPLWTAEIDAHDSTILAFFDGTNYETVHGGVFPISADGDCLAGGCEVAGFPMPFTDYTETGQPETFTDAFGNLTCGAPESSIETNLIGQYIEVVDNCGTLSESGTCGEGLDLGLKYGENCDVEPGASPGNSAAARTGFYQLNRAAEAARFYDPTNAWLQQRLTLLVNGGGTCNAFWNGNVNMYGAGNGCANTGELHGVLVHEWGHGYDDNDGGGMDAPGEAYADIVALFAGRDSCISRGLYIDGRTCSGYGDTCLTCTGLRDHDWAARERNTPVTAANFVTFCSSQQFHGPCRREAHCEAYLTGEIFYDFATRDLPASGLDIDSAWQLAERLWYETRPGSGGNAYFCYNSISNSCDAGSWYQKMRVADDDDGDLSNGTPHAAAMYAAFARHNLACGAVGDPENQSTSNCPALAAPQLDLTETGSGTELSWGAVSGAAEYRVYRGELGCDRQQVGLASLTGGETTYLDEIAEPTLPRYYRVEAFGSNHACTSPVSNCASTPLTARLQKNDHRVLDADANGLPEPGETVLLPVTLFNSGLDDALVVTGGLRIPDPAQGRVLDPDATWANIAASDVGESDAPHFELTVFEDVSCGDTLTFEVDASAANAVPIQSQIRIPLGEPFREFFNYDPVAIPPETTSPVTSTLLIDQDQTIADLDVSVRISHEFPAELIVELTSPDGTTVRLHDQSTGTQFGLEVRYDLDRDPDGPGTLADFLGETTLGTWTLAVEDVNGVSTADGTLYDWGLHVVVAGAFDCQPKTCPEPTPTETPGDLLLSEAVNGFEVDIVFDWSAITAAGYHVLQSTGAAFDSAVDLIGRTDAATTLTLTDGVNTTPDLTYFQVRGVNSCNQEGP